MLVVPSLGTEDGGGGGGKCLFLNVYLVVLVGKTSEKAN